MKFSAQGMDHRTLNERVRASGDSLAEIADCLGQRYIAAGLSGKTLRLWGTPGNALGAYLDGCSIEVFGNVQDAVGDTMNDGTIVVHGNAGDALGYAMRGGKIFVRGDVGYRAGIHMKAYKDHRPVIVVGGVAGSFLGEYQAGGVLVVLDLDRDPAGIVGNFCGTGMHGGEMYLRCAALPHALPAQVRAERLERVEDPEILQILSEYAAAFGIPSAGLAEGPYFRLTPNTENPYRLLYTNN